MVKKLLLEEDDFTEVVDEQESSVDILSKTNLISSLIKGEWDAIDQYNAIIASLEQMGDTEGIEVLKEIVSEEYIHVGQLEKLAQDVNPEVLGINDGHEHEEVDHDLEEVE